MGIVLEMIARRFPVLLVAALAMALAGCGTDSDETLTAQTFAAAGKKLLGRGGSAATGPTGLTRASLATLPLPVDLATIETRRASALIFAAGQNGPVETWTAIDDKTIAFQNNQIVATRGLGGDLIAANVPPIAVIAAGTQSHDRVLVTIGRDDKTQRSTYYCTLSVAGGQTITIVERSYATRRVQENCAGDDGSFTNDYWFQGGTLRQSRQWVGKNLGHIVIARLRD